MNSGTTQQEQDDFEDIVALIEEELGVEIPKEKFLKTTRDRADGRQEYVDYAYQVGGYELVGLIECENSEWNPFRKAYGKEDSWGFCMIHRRRHKDIVDNKLFRSDWKWQIDRCNDLMKSGTRFYGPTRQINGMACSEYVRDRFDFGF